MHITGFWTKDNKVPKPRRLEVGKVGWLDWEIYYVPTGIRVPHVIKVDLDAGECWQYVWDPLNNSYEREGIGLRVRRLRGEFELRSIL